jgi:hypothetical protein
MEVNSKIKTSAIQPSSGRYYFFLNDKQMIFLYKASTLSLFKYYFNTFIPKGIWPISPIWDQVSKNCFIQICFFFLPGAGRNPNGMTSIAGKPRVACSYEGHGGLWESLNMKTR